MSSLNDVDFSKFKNNIGEESFLREFDGAMNLKLLECIFEFKKFDADKSVQMVNNLDYLVKNFCRNINVFPTLETYRKYLQENMYNVLEHRDSKLGLRVAIIRIGQWNPDIYPFNESMLLFLILLLQLSCLRDEFRDGILMIHDFHGFQWKHLKCSFKPSYFKSFALLENSIPLRTKGLHYIFTPVIFNIYFRMAKLIMKEKVQKRVHIHGDSTKSLHEHIQAEILPETLGGGIQLERDAYDQNIAKYMIESDHFYQLCFKIWKKQRSFKDEEF